MNPTGGATRQTPICIICTKKDSSKFGGRSLVKSSCSQGHQFHLDCEIRVRSFILHNTCRLW